MHFLIDLKIYPIDVLVSIDESEETLKGVLKKYGVEDCKINPMGQANGRCIQLYNDQIVIRFVRQKENDKQIGVIAHEAFHATTFIMDIIGMKMKIEVSDEAYAYLLGFITREIYKKMFP